MIVAGDPTVGLYGLLSALLTYPDTRWHAELPAIAGAAEGLASRRGRRSVDRFVVEVERMDPADLESAYVTTFDFDRRATLYLTFHRFGDRRERGMQLARLVRRYADAGLAIDGGELPDYLPIVLEFADLVGGEEGAAALNELREPIELVRGRLHELRSPYVHLLGAITAELPDLSRAQREAIKDLAEAEPPTELVGLPTFGVEDALPPTARGCGS